ncbi:MAG TPA: 3-phosphoshikimate 1-carboxyvinyltransferase, partial [Patescibacteria group bacterium]|nr:3-phosphoshikimate 1-carboxyvinyltransferase [Patescibacteria group bacterium]
RREADVVEVFRDPARDAALNPVDVDMGDIPDMVPSLASVAMFATGPTSISNIGHLRVKETDRIEGVAACLRALGATVDVGADFLVVRPPVGGASKLHSGDIDPRSDHRLAMAFSIAGLAIPGVRILDPGCVGKSFPGFFDQLQAPGRG